MPRKPSVPSYRLHKPTGQAVVTFRTAGGGRRDVYLGAHGSPESRAAYARVLAEQATSPVASVAPTNVRRLTCDQLILAFLAVVKAQHSADYLAEMKNVVRHVHKLYGRTPAAEFGAKALKAVRSAMVAVGNCRTLVNWRTNKIRQVWNWGVGEELVPAETLVALKAVAPLKLGQARESEPVRPVDDAIVDAALAHMQPAVAALVTFQRLTGCRPGEARNLRAGDIDTSSDLWVYRPRKHKTAHRGIARAIPLGPKAKLLVYDAVASADPDTVLFAHKNDLPFSRREYLNRISRACKNAGVAPFHPNQVRHSVATKVRKQFGLEAAGAVLGHSKMSVTEVYAERDEALAAKVASAVG